MSIAKKGLSAIAKLLSVVLLLAAFGVGLSGVVYVSLSGAEIAVPEIVGKDFVQSEKELAALGLKIKKRADRASSEPINTVLEQLPKPGETVKTGQMILVVVSKSGVEAETPPSLKKDVESDDSEKIEEMISDKPKKPKANSNTNKKKADTLRDTSANTATSTTNSNSSDKDKTDDPKAPANPADKNRNAGPGVKPAATPVPQRPSASRPPTGEPGRRPDRP